MQVVESAGLDRFALFALIAVLLACARYATYFISIYRHQTRPHAFSWFLWSLMVGIGTLAQFRLGGGPSAWALLFVSVSCLAIAVMASFVGERDYRRSDWIALGGALAAIPLWRITDNPLCALLVLMVIDGFSYYPTVRKCFMRPDTEPTFSYILAGARYLFVALAVPEPTWQNLVYPLFLMLNDWVFVVYLVIRRAQLGMPLHEYGKPKGRGEDDVAF